MFPELDEIKDDDLVGPLIANVRTEPETIQAGESFHVLCDITDPSGVFDAEAGSYEKGIYLLYDTTEALSSGKEVPLSKKSGDTFITDQEISVPFGEKSIFFRIYAWDADEAPQGVKVNETLPLSVKVEIELDEYQDEKFCAIVPILVGG